MIRYRAAWVLPIAGPPIPGGVVNIERDRIVSVGRFEGGTVDELGAVALLPGLVNAHTHLELSWMRGQVPPRDSMPAWAATLMALRRAVSKEPAEPVVDAIRQARASGTCLLGDVTNTLTTYEPLLESDLSAVLFRELLGFSAPDPDGLVAAAAAEIADVTPVAWLRPSIVPHAPYSVSPDLVESIARWHRERRAGDGARGAEVSKFSVHLGESAQEIEFLRSGTGEWRALLESLGVWNPRWMAPACGPVEYFERLGVVGPDFLAVHGVHFTDDDLERLAGAGATIVACPRSNRWTGAGTPPIDRFYASGTRVAVGTDSLASVQDLNLFAELAEMRRLAPKVPASRLIESATRAGADALGFGSELGSLEPGKRARILAVRVPSDVDDVEEYLVSGIDPDEVTWLDSE
jgi:cytosine/adenosine deaminase-related metal-dependent hydrolase